MQVTERDILGVVHASDAEGLRLRAKSLLKRVARRHRWRHWRAVRLAYCVVLLALSAMILVPLVGALIRVEPDTPLEMPVWSFYAMALLLGVGFLVGLGSPLLFARLELRIIRRWPGNPFRIVASGNALDATNSSFSARRRLLEQLLDIQSIKWRNLGKVRRMVIVDPMIRRRLMFGLVLFYTPSLAVLLLSAAIPINDALGSIACSSIFGLAILCWLPVSISRRHRELIRMVLPSLLDRASCPRCKYDLRGGHIVRESNEIRIRCPECGWSGLVEEMSPEGEEQ